MVASGRGERQGREGGDREKERTQARLVLLSVLILCCWPAPFPPWLWPSSEWTRIWEEGDSDMVGGRAREAMG